MALLASCSATTTQTCLTYALVHGVKPGSKLKVERRPQNDPKMGDFVVDLNVEYGCHVGRVSNPRHQLSSFPVVRNQTFQKLASQTHTHKASKLSSPANIPRTGFHTSGWASPRWPHSHASRARQPSRHSLQAVWPQDMSGIACTPEEPVFPKSGSPSGKASVQPWRTNSVSVLPDTVSLQ